MLRGHWNIPVLVQQNDHSKPEIHTWGSNWSKIQDLNFSKSLINQGGRYSRLRECCRGQILIPWLFPAGYVIITEQKILRNNWHTCSYLHKTRRILILPLFQYLNRDLAPIMNELMLGSFLGSNIVSLHKWMWNKFFHQNKVKRKIKCLKNYQGLQK